MKFSGISACFSLQLLELLRSIKSTLDFLEAPDPARLGAVKHQLGCAFAALQSHEEFSMLLEHERGRRLRMLRAQGYDVKTLAELFKISRRRVYQLCALPEAKKARDNRRLRD